MSGASFKIPPRPAVQRRVTFAVALHEAKDTERHPWVYASDPVDHGHGLMVAHCVKSCAEPAGGHGRPASILNSAPTSPNPGQAFLRFRHKGERR